ncbi:MAG: hypothetical protein M3O22_03790 [Pseudomonadota bacterium]|nr:hypothetical protein [Pseudomonadota bacterium]
MLYPPRKRSFTGPVLLVLVAGLVAAVLFLGFWNRDIPRTMVEREVPHDAAP